MSCRSYIVSLSISCGVSFSWYKSNATSNSALMKCKLVEIAYAPISGSVAEWSKALVLAASLFGGVGSNPTAAKFHFCMRTLSRLKHQGTLIKGIGATSQFSPTTCLLRALTEFYNTHCDDFYFLSWLHYTAKNLTVVHGKPTSKFLDPRFF